MRIRILLAYAVVYLVWGSTYYFIKSAVQTLPAMYVVGIRFIIGGACLMTFLWAVGRLKILPTIREFFSSMLIGILLLIGGNGFVTYAEKRVDSYFAALIVATTPVFVQIFDWLFFKKPIRRNGLIGACIGLCGVGLLLFDGRQHAFTLTLHEGFIFCGVFFWSLGTSISKVLKLPEDLMVHTGIQLTSVGIIALLGVQFFQPVFQVPWAEVTSASWTGVFFLALFGTFAFGMYAYLLKYEPNHRIVSYALVNPVIAVAIGILIGGEVSVTYLVPGTLLILTGLCCMIYLK